MSVVDLHSYFPTNWIIVVDFGELESGQMFLHGGSVYTKKDDRWAVLIRLASGHEPDSQTVHTFYPEDEVEPVQEGDG